jgi:hypothetical protein
MERNGVLSFVASGASGLESHRAEFESRWSWLFRLLAATRAPPRANKWIFIRDASSGICFVARRAGMFTSSSVTS